MEDEEFAAKKAKHEAQVAKYEAEVAKREAEAAKREQESASLESQDLAKEATGVRRAAVMAALAALIALAYAYVAGPDAGGAILLAIFVVVCTGICGVLLLLGRVSYRLRFGSWRRDGRAGRRDALHRDDP